MVRLAAGDPEDGHLLMLKERHVPLSAASLRSLGLTSREAEVLAGIAQGKTDKAMAEGLYVSPLTVKTHCNASTGRSGSRAAPRPCRGR